MKLIIISILLFVNLGYSQPPDNFYFFNPGIKLGYTFGQNGGFSYGFEMSFIKTGDKLIEPKYGVVVGIDRVNDVAKYHFGLQYLGGIIGGEVGPSIIVRDGNINYGFQFTPFLASIIIIPFYSYTFVLNNNDFHEIGSFIKLPFQIIPSRSKYIYPISEG